MPFDKTTGQIARLHSWANDAAVGIPMDPSRLDADFDDLVRSLNESRASPAPELIAGAVHEAVAKLNLVHRHEHDTHVGRSATRDQIVTLERLIAQKGQGVGTGTSTDQVHAILDQRLAGLPAAPQTAMDAPTRAEMASAIARAVKALPAVPAQPMGVAGDSGLTIQDVTAIVQAAVAQSAEATKQEFHDTIRAMFAHMAMIETITLAEGGHELQRSIIAVKAGAAGKSYDDFVTEELVAWEAMKHSALGHGVN